MYTVSIYENYKKKKKLCNSWKRKSGQMLYKSGRAWWKPDVLRNDWEDVKDLRNAFLIMSSSLQTGDW